MKLQTFLGKGVPIAGGLSLFSPTIAEIAELGEDTYHLYYHLATFNTEILHSLNLLSSDHLPLESDEFQDGYSTFTSLTALAEWVAQALSFFCRQEISYYPAGAFFYHDQTKLMVRENNAELVSIIKMLNGVKEEKKVVFRNHRARKLYEKLQNVRKKTKEEESLELKDLLSILCQAEGNGIDIFNVGRLTIYQVYEHFERLTMKENHKRLLGVWANGLLKENHPLPEWMVKSKL